MEFRKKQPEKTTPLDHSCKTVLILNTVIDSSDNRAIVGRSRTKEYQLIKTP
jgi:hypothetical protein